jgi:hypothetical protein
MCGMKRRHNVRQNMYTKENKRNRRDIHEGCKDNIYSMRLNGIEYALLKEASRQSLAEAMKAAA